MNSFRNILVGVDLARGRSLHIEQLSRETWELIDHAIWLARRSDASLLFFTALNLTAAGLHHIAEEDRHHVTHTVEELANTVLANLVARAEKQGVKARHQLALGEGWLEITRQVLRERHDLVIVGTRSETSLRRILFGSTAFKLLRRCPCPVWVTKPGHTARPLKILIAMGLGPTCAVALSLGAFLGGILGGEVHVLRVVEYPLDFLWSTTDFESDTAQYHHKIRADAWHGLQQQLQAIGAPPGGPALELHLKEGVGNPDEAIQQFITDEQIDLLILGTIARAGILGIMIGNTAERVLPEVGCSVLAVKPPDFKCPVMLTPG